MRCSYTSQPNAFANSYSIQNSFNFQILYSKTGKTTETKAKDYITKIVSAKAKEKTARKCLSFMK